MTSPNDTGGFCYFCSEVGPKDAFSMRRLMPESKPFPGCVDHEACDGRARARYGVDHFALEYGQKTPPGVALVAVILASARPVPHLIAQRAVDWMRRYVPDDNGRAYASDLSHAVVSGIIVNDRSAETYAPGPCFETIAASVRASQVHIDGARDALVVIGFLPPKARGHFLDRYTRSVPSSPATGEIPQ